MVRIWREGPVIRLSRLADYGVVLMTQLARDRAHDREGLRNTGELAAATGLPQPTVGKLLKLLAHNGLLESHRGIKGGYALARSPGEISMADIIFALDGPIALTECIGDDGSLCEIEALCPTRTNWMRINGAITDALSGVTLEEMAFPTAFLTPTERRAQAGAAE